MLLWLWLCYRQIPANEPCPSPWHSYRLLWLRWRFLQSTNSSCCWLSAQVPQKRRFVQYRCPTISVFWGFTMKIQYMYNVFSLSWRVCVSTDGCLLWLYHDLSLSIQFFSFYAALLAGDVNVLLTCFRWRRARMDRTYLPQRLGRVRGLYRDTRHLSSNVRTSFKCASTIWAHANHLSLYASYLSQRPLARVGQWLARHTTSSPSTS